jgi:RND superfamily putative drug exporter
MSAFLYALGGLAFRARWRVVLTWCGVLAVVLGAAVTVGSGTNNTYSFPGTQSQNALDSLGRTFAQFAGTSAQVVAAAPSGGRVTDPAFTSAVGDAVTALGKIPQVQTVSSPYSGESTGNVSADGSAVIIPVQMTVAAADVLPTTSDALQAEGRTLLAALPEGSDVAVGGQLFAQVNPGIGISEVSGLAIALVVLLFTFGTLVAAGMPIITAVVGVGTSVGVVLTATRFLTITSTAPLLAVMLGLAVGVDYALFIISRHQDQLRQGMTPEESAPRAVATAGSAVAFAATTVIIALLGLSVARIPFLTITGLASALAVACAALVALTLTPALLAFGGWHLVRRRDRPGRPAADPDDDVDDGAPADVADDAPPDEDAAEAEGPDPDGREGDASGEVAEDAGAENSSDTAQPGATTGGFFGHWVRAATRWPPLTVVVVAGLLVLAALPASGLRLALPDAGALSPGEPGRVAYDLVDEHFGPGYNGPLIVTGSVIRSTDPVTLVNDLATDISEIPGVAAVPLATPNQTGDTAVLQVVPTGAPDSAETEDVVTAIRARHGEYLEQYGVDLAVTGSTALGIDISTRLGGAVLPFGLLVVGLSLVLLAMVFRSVVVPVTAALGYALSIGAAFGLTSLVFMHGWLEGPLNILHVGSVTSFMPIILMGVLFGLAMDYEVFLVSRMREDYVHHGDPHEAVHRGFHASARVVTAAALIMTAVFAGFVRGGQASIQPIALGLTVGVLIDAFVVRMTLVPALLTWFGRAAWWFPDVLDRVLPHFDVEGEGLSQEEALADWPEPETDLAVAAESVVLPGPEARDEVDVFLTEGEALVVEGAAAADRRRLLLGLTGRGPLEADRCKVAGLVLPVRAGSVRARTALVLLDEVRDPVAAVATALLGDVLVLALAEVSSVTDVDVRRELREVLREGRAGVGARTGRPLTVLLSTATDTGAEGVLPRDHDVHHLALDPLGPPARAAQEVDVG